ncbi:MAG: AI-2E family transporter [Actinobacteria bacterium]|nr:AI-2E family transporter [Actinomycetota bacterium]
MATKSDSFGRNWKEFVEPAKSLLIIALAIYVLYLAIKSLMPVLTPFIIGLFITYMLRPLYLFFRHRKLPKPLSLLFTYLIFIVLLVLLLVIFIPMLVAQAKEFVQYIPKIEKNLMNLIDRLKEFLSRYNVTSQIEGFIQRGFGDLSSRALNIFRSVSIAGISFISSMLNLILAFIISVYFLKDWKPISETIKAFLKGAFGDSAVEFLTESNRKIALFVRGQIIVAAITGLISGIVLYILGVPLAGFLGVLVAIFDLVPYFGPIFAGSLAVLLALSVSPYMAIWTALTMFLVQQFESMFLSPMIVGKNTEIHPIAILFSFLLGATLFGFIGIIIAVPAAGIIKVWLQRNFLEQGRKT